MASADRWLVPRIWPADNIATLLRACLHPDEAVARAAWQAWITTHDFDAVTPHETRLLANLSTRIAALDPRSPFRPRMEGVARQNWTRTQLVIAGAMPAIDALKRAGIPFVLFKGAAQYAEGLATETRRVMGDLDILVPESEMRGAITTLAADGWASERGDSAVYLAAVADVRIGINLRRGAVGEVDIHRSPFHVSGRDAVATARLWETARAATLQGRAVQVAAPEVSVIASLVHAFASRGGDWAIDVATRLRHQAIDWDGVKDLATRWRQVLPVRIALRWLRDHAGQPVPDGALAALDAVPVGLVDRARFWSMVRVRDRHQPVVRQVVRQALTPILWRRGDITSISDRNAVQIVGTRRLAAAAIRPSASGTWGVETTVAAPPRGRRLALTLEVERPLRRRRVHFDVIDNDSLVAHIRVTLVPGETPARVTAIFDRGAGSGRLAISSRPTRATNADDIQPASLPVRFRVADVRKAGPLLARLP